MFSQPVLSPSAVPESTCFASFSKKSIGCVRKETSGPRPSAMNVLGTLRKPPHILFLPLALKCSPAAPHYLRASPSPPPGPADGFPRYRSYRYRQSAIPSHQNKATGLSLRLLPLAHTLHRGTGGLVTASRTALHHQLPAHR